MSALDLVQGISQALYVAIFVLAAWRYLRAPTPAHLDMSLFFAILAFVVVESRLAAQVQATLPAWFTDVLVVAILALPYVLIRLVDDFTHVPALLKRATELALVVLSVVFVLIYQPPEQPPAPYTLALLAYMTLLLLYSGARFIFASRQSHGVTRRRLQAISLGAILFAVQIVTGGSASLFAEPDRTLLSGIGQVLGLLSAIAFFLGFTPPPVLRRAWQAPELRDLLTRAASLPRLPTTLDIVRELEQGAAGATGANARVGIWQEEESVLRFWSDENEPRDVAPGQHFAGRAFEQQRTIFSADPIKDDPQGVDAYRKQRIGAVIASPITAGGRRLGVLVLSAERPPIFAISDRELTQLLADQAAVILESRALIDHAARVRAREEATRMKEDFLSAAAHDLKTPLTTVVAQAQFLERKALRDPSAPQDVPGLQRIVREAQRLSALVTDLLDAARLEQGRLVSEREPVDLGELVTQVVRRQPAGRHATELDVRGVVVGTVDRRRIEQLVENLLENAKKYSPEATPVNVSVWQTDSEAHISVRDHGIGIPPGDLPRIFERFSRASNVDDRKFHGMGLGLYICRGIVEEHGGRIWADSELGKGSTFHVAIPLSEGRRLN